MDSLTQVVLGAAVGEAALGRKAGRAATAWGAFFGTLPDLDILLNPFLDPVQSLAMHRAFSHSIVFAAVMAPLAGALLHRLHRSRGATFRGWSALVWWCLFTHALLDTMTVYGTQLLWPFTNHPFGVDSVFIIDPLYTLPLAAGLLITLFTRHRRPVLLALAVSTMYLGWSVGAKSVADHHMKRTFVDFGVSTERYMSTPTALNTLLYIGMADTGDSLVTTTFSLVDGRRPTPPRTVATRRALLQAHLRDRAVSRVDWFSKGWWLARETGDGIEMIDPRFGRSDLFLTGSGHYVFRFKLRADSSGDYYSFYQMPPELLDPGALLGSVRDRVTGHQPDGDRRRNADSAGT